MRHASAPLTNLASRLLSSLTQVNVKLEELAKANGVDWDDDKAVVALFDKSASAIQDAGKEYALGAVSNQLEELIAPLDGKQRESLLKFLTEKVK